MEPPPRRHGPMRPDRDAPARVALVVVAGVLSILMFLLLRSCSQTAILPPSQPTDTTSHRPQPRLASPLYLAGSVARTVPLGTRAGRRGSSATDETCRVAASRRVEPASAWSVRQGVAPGHAAEGETSRALPAGAPRLSGLRPASHIGTCCSWHLPCVSGGRTRRSDPFVPVELTAGAHRRVGAPRSFSNRS
jgi:hypothetical protein